MAKLFNRAKMTTSTTGSGTVTLGSASVGYQSFADAGVSNGDVVQYVIEEGGNFEIGTGTYSATGTSLTRSPTESSNSNNAITLAGAATVSITAVADDLNRLQHEGSTKVAPSATGATVTGNLAVTGTVDGRDVAADGTKLDNIEANATADQTAAEIRTLVESATDSNVFTDADHTKLNGIESGATADQTAAEILTAIKTVDGSGSGLDADTLDGSHASAFLTGNQTITLTGDASGSGTTSINVTVANDSHTHDGRYYTETEADARFLGISAKAADADLLDGYNASTGGSVNTVVVRNASGYIFGNYFNGNGTFSLTGNTSGMGLFTGTNGTDTYGRSYTAAAARTLLNVENGATADQTITAGSGLTGGGTGDVTISHSDTSTLSGTYGSTGNGTKIDQITVDALGHVTAITTGATGTMSSFQLEDGDGTEVTISNGKEVKFVEGGGIDINWTDTSTGSDGDPYDLTFTHADTSSQASVNNSGRTYIQDITLDGYGHVTAISSATETVTDTTYSAGNNMYLSGTQFNVNSSPIFNSVLIGNRVTLQESTDRADLLQITSETAGWGGLQIRNSSNEGRWSFMTDGTTAGIYDDENNEWHIKLTENAGTQMYHNNVEKLAIGSSYTEMYQRLDMNNNDIYGVDQIVHHGDTNTYMQFHAADQWRVVVGGSERLEVKNSSPHVLVTGDLNSTSDARLKENVEPITNALSDVSQLEGVSFDWKDTGTRGHGFIAQQVEPILPDVVQTDEETGIKSINYVGMIGHLVEAIKELKAEIEELKR